MVCDSENLPVSRYMNVGGRLRSQHHLKLQKTVSVHSRYCYTSSQILICSNSPLYFNIRDFLLYVELCRHALLIQIWKCHTAQQHQAANSAFIRRLLRP